MPNTKDITPGGLCRMLWIGVSGSWKTMCACSFPGRIYVFDFDDRIEPVALRYPERDDIDYDKYRVGDWGKAVEKMRKITERCEYRLVVLDSLTAIGDLTTVQSKEETKTGKVRGGMKMSGPDDFNFESNAIVKILMFMKQLPCHSILTAHLTKWSEADPNAGMEGISKKIERSQIVAGTNKVAARVPVYFNEIYHFDLQSGFNPGDPKDLIISTETNQGVNCRTALPLPPQFKINSSRDFYSSWMHFINAGKVKVEVAEPAEALPVITF